MDIRLQDVQPDTTLPVVPAEEVDEVVPDPSPEVSPSPSPEAPVEEENKVTAEGGDEAVV